MSDPARELLLELLGAIVASPPFTASRRLERAADAAHAYLAAPPVGERQQPSGDEAGGFGEQATHAAGAAVEQEEQAMEVCVMRISQSINADSNILRGLREAYRAGWISAAERYEAMSVCGPFDDPLDM